MSEMTKEQRKAFKKNKKRVKPGRLAKREAITGLLFVTPWIIGACLFLAYPLITSFWYALNNIRITPIGKNFNFVGYGNFTQILLSDADFPTQLININHYFGSGYRSVCINDCDDVKCQY